MRSGHFLKYQKDTLTNALGERQLDILRCVIWI